MPRVSMDPDIYRLVALVILFLFFTVGVNALGGDSARRQPRKEPT